MTVVAHDEAQSLKARIFSAAIAVFAEHGLSGARMEQIATEAQTTKRMVVYYFKNKEQLYQEVLQHVCADPRNRAAAGAGECTAGGGAGTAGALERALSRHPCGLYARHLHGEYAARQVVKTSGELKPLNRTALSILEDILLRGQQQGVFRAGLDARDVHRLISSFSFYQVSNFYTFSSLYLDDPLPAIDDEAMVAHHCDIAVRAVVRFVIS